MALLTFSGSAGSRGGGARDVFTLQNAHLPHQMRKERQNKGIEGVRCEVIFAYAYPRVQVSPMIMMVAVAAP